MAKFAIKARLDDGTASGAANAWWYFDGDASDLWNFLGLLPKMKRVVLFRYRDPADGEGAEKLVKLGVMKPGAAPTASDGDA